MNAFASYYDPKCSDVQVLKDLYKILTNDMRSRAHRATRHALYREVLTKRAQALRILFPSTTH